MRPINTPASRAASGFPPDYFSYGQMPQQSAYGYPQTNLPSRAPMRQLAPQTQETEEREEKPRGSGLGKYVLPAAALGATVAGGLAVRNAIGPAPRSKPLTSLTDAEKINLTNKFEGYKNKLETDGVLAGTYHKRIPIPKTQVGQDDLLHLGFQPVAIAIPESGQKSFYSYRHPKMLHHLHDHGDYWTMHVDEHPSMTMALQSAKTLGAKLKAVASGTQHIVTEGLPGLYKYIANRFEGGEGMLDAVKRDMALAGKKIAAYDVGRDVALRKLRLAIL